MTLLGTLKVKPNQLIHPFHILLAFFYVLITLCGTVYDVYLYIASLSGMFACLCVVYKMSSSITHFLNSFLWEYSCPFFHLDQVLVYHRYTSALESLEDKHISSLFPNTTLIIFSN